MQLCHFQSKLFQMVHDSISVDAFYVKNLLFISHTEETDSKKYILFTKEKW